MKLALLFATAVLLLIGLVTGVGATPPPPGPWIIVPAPPSAATLLPPLATAHARRPDHRGRLAGLDCPPVVSGRGACGRLGCDHPGRGAARVERTNGPRHRPDRGLHPGPGPERLRQHPCTTAHHAHARRPA